MVLALLALFFPACPSDGITANEPPVCVWEASAEGMYVGGVDFVAFNSPAGNYAISIP